MSEYYYNVQFEKDGRIITCETPHDVFVLLTREKLISVFRYNNSKTGSAYARAAKKENLTVAEQEASPIYISTVLSDEGMFVQNEEFWIENYMFDEFYNPDKMPYIEKMIK